MNSIQVARTDLPSTSKIFPKPIWTLSLPLIAQDLDARECCLASGCLHKSETFLAAQGIAF